MKSSSAALKDASDGHSDTPPINKKSNEKYSLRQRNKRENGKIKLDTLNQCDTGRTTTGKSKDKTKPKAKSKAAPLSKYRRKTANARERTRMREINSAFENLRKCVPVSMSGVPQTTVNEKLTKITTLRLAMKYIKTLSELLNRTNGDPSSLILHNHNNNNYSVHNNNSSSLNNNYKEMLSELAVTPTPSIKHLKRTLGSATNLKSKLTLNKLNKCVSLSPPCLSPMMNDATTCDLGLLLESDGESLHLSEPCLSPLSQSLKTFTSCSPVDSAIELGLLLESDTDSLQLSEPCLSPLSSLDSLNPFNDLLHSGFNEATALDMYLT